MHELDLDMWHRYAEIPDSNSRITTNGLAGKSVAHRSGGVLQIAAVIGY